MDRHGPDVDRQGVHRRGPPERARGIAVLGATTLVEKFTAEHSWFLDFEKKPDLSGIASQIDSALKLVPQLADRLPI